MEISGASGKQSGQSREYKLETFNTPMDNSVFTKPMSDDVFEQQQLFKDQQNVFSVKNWMESVKEQDNTSVDLDNQMGKVVIEKAEKHQTGEGIQENLHQKALLDYNPDSPSDVNKFNYSQVVDVFVDEKLQGKMTTERHYFKDEQNREHYVTQNNSHGSEVILDKSRGTAEVNDYYYKP